MSFFNLEILISNLIDFNYQNGTGTRGSCSFLQHDKMYIVGGSRSNHSSQIAIVEGCELRLVGELPNAFRYGACNNYINQDGNREALLCFGEMDVLWMKI